MTARKSRKAKPGERVCTIEGCGRPYSCRGMCISHYSRWRKTGVSGGPIWDKPDTSSFLPTALKFEGDNCLIWPYGRAKSGYGMVYPNGKPENAHRVVCRLAHGDPPTPEHHAAHSCGVRACVNPRHLRWATRVENFSDMIAHGTKTLGERHPQSKLNETQVKDIRASVGKVSKYALAKRYGVSHSTITDVITGKTWGHVSYLRREFGCRSGMRRQRIGG